MGCGVFAPRAEIDAGQAWANAAAEGKFGCRIGRQLHAGDGRPAIEVAKAGCGRANNKSANVGSDIVPHSMRRATIIYATL